MDKAEKSSRAMKSLFDSTWTTLYIQPNLHKMFIIQTYEHGGVEHYVKSRKMEFTPDDHEIKKPWSFRRVVIVEGSKAGFPLISSHLVYFDGELELRRNKCESKFRIHDVTWGKIGLMRSGSVISCDSEHVFERNAYLRAVSPKRRSEVRIQNKDAVSRKKGGAAIKMTEPLVATDSGVVTETNEVSDPTPSTSKATDKSKNKKKKKNKNKKKDNEPLSVRDGDNRAGDKAASSLNIELKGSSSKEVSPADLTLNMSLLSLNDALTDATSVGSIAGKRVDPFSSGGYVLETERSGLCRYILVDGSSWWDLDSFPSGKNVARFVRDSGNVAYFKV